MALYTKESKDRVRDAVDFVELVSARTDLRRAGPARYEGLCPFHEERTPSFGIDPTQKVYYCFGCQASGDLFTFVQESEGLDFRGTLELLAERYNVELELEEEDPREAERRKRRERLLELLSRTASYYERCLWDSSEAAKARAYLARAGPGRGDPAPVPGRIRPKRLGQGAAGLAPRRLLRAGALRDRPGPALAGERAALRPVPGADHLPAVGHPRARAGLRRAGAAEDGPAEASGTRPKYLNTSDTDVYHKGLHLYGADLARSHAAKAGSVILCEGYTDVIALHQAGLRNAVGSMGTALTVDQVSELARMAQTVLLALDADSAGQEAMLKASTLAAKRKLELRVVPLPAGD